MRHRTFFRGFFGFLALLLLIQNFASQHALAAAPPAQVAISPTLFELKLGNKPLNESIRFMNLKKEPVSVKIEVYNWTMDEQNQVEIIPSTNQSLDQWMIINPLSFTVPPGKTQVIRFSIRPRTRPAPGEHRAIIYLTEQSPKTEPGKENTIKVLFRYGMGVYADTDPVKHASALSSLTFDKASATLKANIVNNGNVRTRLEGNYAIWKAGTFPGFKAMADYLNKPKSDKKPEGLLASGGLNSSPVLPGQQRTIVTSVGTEQSMGGGYVLAVKGTLDDKTVEKLFP